MRYRSVPGGARSVLASRVCSAVAPFEKSLVGSLSDFIEELQPWTQVWPGNFFSCFWSIKMESWTSSKNPPATLSMERPLPLHNSSINTWSRFFLVPKRVLLYGTDTYPNHRPLISVGSSKQIVITCVAVVIYNLHILLLQGGGLIPKTFAWRIFAILASHEFCSKSGKSFLIT